MKYALLVYDVPCSWQSLSEEEKQAISGEYHAVFESPGIVGIAHYQLQPPQMTTTVRVEEGQTMTTAGPLADTREILRGFYLLESDHHDAPLEIAARIPAARMGGAIEVRLLVER